MKDGAPKAFEQAYTAQIAGAGQAQIIIAAAVTQEAHDKDQLVPTLKAGHTKVGHLPEKASAEAGFCSEANVTDPHRAAVALYVPPARQPQGAPPEVVRGVIGMKLRS